MVDSYRQHCVQCKPAGI